MILDFVLFIMLSNVTYYALLDRWVGACLHSYCVLLLDGFGIYFVGIWFVVVVCGFKDYWYDSLP